MEQAEEEANSESVVKIGVCQIILFPGTEKLGKHLKLPPSIEHPIMLL